MIISLSGKIKSGKDCIGQIIQGLDWYYNGYKNSLRRKYTDIEFCQKILSNEVVQYSEFKIKKFADKLKDMVCMMIGCTREQLEDRKFRDTPLGEEWWIYKSKIHGNILNYIEYKDTISYSSNKYKLIKLTPRTLMQLLGTEAGRNIIHPDLWVNCLMSEYKKQSTHIISDKDKIETGTYYIPSLNLVYPNWIITDNRFPNELKAVHNKDGISIRIERDFNLRYPEYNSLEEVQTKNPELYQQLTHYSEVALDACKDFKYIIQNNGNIEELIQQIKNILIKENII